MTRLTTTIETDPRHLIQAAGVACRFSRNGDTVERDKARTATRKGLSFMVWGTPAHVFVRQEGGE